MLYTMHSEFLVEMQCDFTVRTRSERMLTPLELASLAFKVIKLAVHNDMNPVVLIGDRLIARAEVNDAQPGMTKTGATIGREPHPLAVRTAVMESPRSTLQHLR